MFRRTHCKVTAKCIGSQENKEDGVDALFSLFDGKNQPLGGLFDGLKISFDREYNKFLIEKTSPIQKSIKNQFLPFEAKQKKDGFHLRIHPLLLFKNPKMSAYSSAGS